MKKTQKLILTITSCATMTGCSTIPSQTGYPQTGYPQSGYRQPGYPQQFNSQGIGSNIAPALIQAGMNTLANSVGGIPPGVTSAIVSASSQILNQGNQSSSPYYQRVAYRPNGYGYQNGNYQGDYPTPLSANGRGYQTYRPTVPQYYGY